MSTLTALAAVLAGIGTLAAQSVGVTLSALTPLVVKVDDGTLTSTNSWAPGVLPITGALYTSIPTTMAAAAVVSWAAPFPTNQGVQVRLDHAIDNNGAVPSFSGRCGPHDFLVVYTSAIPRTASLTVWRSVTLAAGATAPSVQIDFDNDGVIDVTDPPNGSTVYPVTFGPLPKQVRIHVDATLGAQLGVQDTLGLYLAPENNLAISQPVATCNPSLPTPPPLLFPSFDDRGVDAILYSNPGEPSLLVFGFTPQPTLLSMNGALPCILLPAPDVVLFANGLFHLPLPASLRPATFFAQGVMLASSGIVTTEGYVVLAN